MFRQTNIQISEVTYGKFEDMLMITAQTQSLQFFFGKCFGRRNGKRNLCRRRTNGAVKGEPLGTMYNPNTEFNFMNQETGIMQQISQMRSSLLELKNQEFNQNKELLQVSKRLQHGFANV